MSSSNFNSKSGKLYYIRYLESTDSELLFDLFFHLSKETIYKRFHAVLDYLPPEHVRREAQRLSIIDPTVQCALVALHNGEAVGVARFHRIPGTTDAESAIVVRDDYQRDGLGTHLLTQLRQRALDMGITHLIAMIQAQNNPVLQVIKRSGLDCTWRFEQGETYLAVDIRHSS